MQAWMILAAAGRGTRAGGSEPKQFWMIGGVPMIVRALRPWLVSSLVEGVVVAVPPGTSAEVAALLHEWGANVQDVVVVDGGETRAQSVRNGLDAVPASCKVVAVHDAARPFVQTSTIERVLRRAREHGAALAAVPVSDTLKRGTGGRVESTLPREGLWVAQTPQAFHKDLLEEAFERAADQGLEVYTDDCSLVEALGVKPVLVAGESANFKVTRQEDRFLAEAMVALEYGRSRKEVPGGLAGLRLGNGFDAHRFHPDRPLVLGGVEVRDRDGLDGHSDADVLAHAVMDALLGAAGLPETHPGAMTSLLFGPRG